MMPLAKLEFTPNWDRSVEFAMSSDVCLGRILESRVGENGIGANAKFAYKVMLEAECAINILDFSGVVHINTGAWGVFNLLMRALNDKARYFRICNLTHEPLAGFRDYKFDAVFPAYNTIEDAIRGERVLNPKAEERQVRIIAQLPDVGSMENSGG